MKVYRIIAEKHSRILKASGYAARWNSRSVEIIYTAQSASLACLENVVHRDYLELSMKFCLVTIQISENITIQQVKRSEMRKGWNDFGENAYSICRRIGDNWIKEDKSAILKVPSVIVKSEYNYLLNPNHPEMKQIKIIDTEPFLFDTRIKE